MQRTSTHYNGRAYQSGKRVNVGSQHGGYLSQKHIPNHPAADPRQCTEEDRCDWTGVKCEGLLRPRYGKQAQAGGVEQQDRAVQPIDERVPEECYDARKHGDGDIPPVADRRGWKGSDHDVPRNTARVSRREAQDQDAEEIEPVLDGFGRAAEREDERSGQVEHRQHSAQGVLDTCRDHADSHACAATTIASTPARKVGWMTGAKRGL